MTTLPNGYREVRRVDLMRNRKEAILINLLALVIAAGVAALGFVFCPPFFEVEIGIHSIVNMILMMVGIVVYMILHEIIHGVFMKAFSGLKPRYGFTGLYAYAGSDALFNRRQYLIIAFAPVVILGIILAVLTVAFYETAFWTLYLIQIVNLSGAAGDFYVGFLIARSNNDVLVRDTGTDMAFYSGRV
ncbi:MAG: hypothetical protein CVV04_03900 [Firmicutes bacterium HGW-Firmicutes-9]|jgi:hypothetical protein|nr:MAG: hypothetical protein CVV04_03900 [Firmicutes bacterium HGW-Firmicutes-9]